jgi:CelD/BcsL family acetyltransferase involved in cellulose biosynthesis
LEGKIIAVFYGMADPRQRKNRSIYYYLNGFDLEYKDLSPGTLLLALALEEARKEGAEGIDLLRGGEEYKELWGAEYRPTYALEYLAAQLVDRPSQSPITRAAA